MQLFILPWAKPYTRPMSELVGKIPTIHYKVGLLSKAWPNLVMFGLGLGHAAWSYLVMHGRLT